MDYIRFRLDLAIPKLVYDAIPAAKKQALVAAIRELKSYARRINEGKPNEEMTIKATWHVCRHESGGSCEPEQEV